MTQIIIAWNPLEPLRDDAEVRSLFVHILLQRIDTRILSGHFGLPESSETIELPNGPVTTADFVKGIVAFLVESSPLGPEETARRFWTRFKFEGWRFPGVPAEVRETLSSYFKIKEDVTDLEMIRDLIDPQFIRLGTVADIGCGRNKLGRSLLRFSDNGSRVVKQVVGTDVNSYEAEADDSRISFVAQTSYRLPLDDSSIDLAIIKWALHHMTQSEIHAQLHEVRRVLRPGGRVAVIEGLVGSWESTRQSIEREKCNAISWPPGVWSERRAKVTDDYLRLSEEQQIQVLALEDYHGHWLEQEFLWMPLPCNYMNSVSWRKLFASAGLVRDDERTRTFGMAPIIHWGPPSIRCVYEKK